MSVSPFRGFYPAGWVLFSPCWGKGMGNKVWMRAVVTAWLCLRTVEEPIRRSVRISEKLGRGHPEKLVT